MKEKVLKTKENVKSKKENFKGKISYIKKYISETFDELDKGINQMFDEFFNKETNKKQRANMWTFSRLVAAGLVPILTLFSVITGTTLPLLFAFGTAAYGAVADYMDGKSARKHNSASEFGEKFDFITDKAFSASVGLSLAILNPIFILPLIGEAAIAGTNIYYKAKEPRIKAKSRKVGKRKQWPLYTTFGLGFLSKLMPKLSLITSLFFGATLAMQAETAIDYMEAHEQEIEELKKQDSESQNEQDKDKDKEQTEEKTEEPDKEQTEEKAEEPDKKQDEDNKQTEDKDNKEPQQEVPRQAIPPIENPPEVSSEPKRKILEQPKQ